MERVEYDLRSNKGFTIFMPPYSEGQEGWGNLAIPDPNNDVNIAQKYPIDTVLRGDERAWRYARAGDIDGDGVTRNIRRGSGIQSEACVNSYTDKLEAAAGFNTKGDYKVKMDLATHVSFLNAETAVAANDYAGGHFTLYTPTSYWGCRIVGNTAEVAGVVELTLESPLPVALESTHIISLEENMYWKVKYPGASGNYATVVGFPCIWSQYKTIASGAGPVADDNFFWLQTWGPYEGIIMGNATGGAEGERAAFMNVDTAAAAYPDENVYPNMAEHRMPQIAGYFTANNYKGGAPADFDYNYLTTFFLMIAP